MIWMMTTLLTFAAPANLVSDASFEGLPVGDALPATWQLLRSGPVAIRDGGGQDGTQYLHVEDPAKDEGTAVESAHQPARPQGTYTLTGWFRTSDPCQPGLYLQFHDLLGQRIQETHVRADGPTDGWVQLTVTGVAPVYAAAVSVLVYGYISDVGAFEVDNLALSVEGGREPGSTGIAAAETGDKGTMDIGDRRELFIDDTLIDGLSGSARRRLHHPQRQNIVLTLDEAWEGPTSAYLTVMRDDAGVHLYYRGSNMKPDHQVTCVADSPDGITFARPKLGLVAYDGSTDNNIVWNREGSHNLAPFLDTNPAAKPEEQYKAVGDGLLAFASPDGRQWHLMQEEKLPIEGAFDSQNLAFWDSARGKYACYFRTFRDGVRSVEVCWSDDFLHWTAAQPLTYGDVPPEHLYTNAIAPYPRAPHLLVGLPARFIPNRQKIPEHPNPGVSDALLMASRDGVAFERWREGYILPGPDPQNWTDRNIYPAWGIIQTSPTEYSLYWTEHYRHDPMVVRRGTIRLDGFVSVRADMDGGELLTRPLTFNGGQLSINYATSAAGTIRIALCDEAGKALPGFGLGDMQPLFGDEIEHGVTWKDGSDTSSLAGKPVRLRVQLIDADLYSFRFGSN